MAWHAVRAFDAAGPLISRSRGSCVRFTSGSDLSPPAARGLRCALYASDGKKRVPYSLRHTYATMRISEGVSVFQLAANMGTSVEMLENFYGKKRMRDPKMATEVTKHRRHEKIT